VVHVGQGPRRPQGVQRQAGAALATGSHKCEFRMLPVRAVIRTDNYSNIRIIKLIVTVRRIFALFEEFNVGLSTFFDSLSQ
jgi:hypothetical protein